MIWYTIGIIISGIGGFLLANYIARNKFDSEHLVCPLGQSCDQVINGRFSHFFGVPVEKMGRLYYVAVVAFYVISLFADFSQTVMGYALLITGISFAFSMYLTMTQLFVLKKWCTLCLGSAALSFMILVLAFLGFESSFADFIYSYRDLLHWIYVVAVLVGVVVTTIHMTTFMKFLRDFQISRQEERRLRMFSHTAWVAIIAVVLSGIGLVLTDVYNDIVGGEVFIVMVAIVGILIIYEVVVNMIVAPRLIDLHFNEDSKMDDHEYSYQRKLAFAFSAIGVVSWYMLLLFSTVSFYPYTSATMFIIYAVLLVIFVVIALIAEHMMYKKYMMTSSQQQTNIESKEQTF